MLHLAIRLAAACLALAGVALADEPYNITVWYQQNSRDVYARAWYGDGNLYVGPTVPPSVKKAFNFTVPNTRADLLYVEPSPLSADPSLPDPTFLTLNNAPGAVSTVRFRHSAADLTDDDLLFWLRYGNLMFVILQDGSFQGYFFLEPVGGTPGTYLVKWRQGGVKQPADAATPSQVTLLAVDPSSE